MKIYNLFISHSWTHSDKYEKLEGLLRGRSYFSFHNYSVPKDDPIHTRGSSTALYNAIHRKMVPCHVILILAGVYATYSKWIENEISIAKSEFSSPKPIIAIEHWGSERTSRRVKDNADRVVKWNTNSIVDAIREVA